MHPQIYLVTLWTVLEPSDLQSDRSINCIFMLLHLCSLMRPFLILSAVTVQEQNILSQ